jgi:hypothetical protein
MPAIVPLPGLETFGYGRLRAVLPQPRLFWWKLYRECGLLPCPLSTRGFRRLSTRGQICISTCGFLVLFTRGLVSLSTLAILP